MVNKQHLSITIDCHDQYSDTAWKNIPLQLIRSFQTLVPPHSFGIEPGNPPCLHIRPSQHRSTYSSANQFTSKEPSSQIGLHFSSEESHRKIASANIESDDELRLPPSRCQIRSYYISYTKSWMRDIVPTYDFPFQIERFFARQQLIGFLFPSYLPS